MQLAKTLCSLECVQHERGAQYYATIFLNQLVLTRKDARIAQTLLLIYLSLFGARAKVRD